MRRPFLPLVALELALAGALLMISARAAEPMTPTVPPPPTSDAANALLITQAQARADKAQAAGDFAGLAAALNDEGDAQLRLHQFDAAERLRLRVLHLEEQHAGRESLAVSDALLNLGLVLRQHGPLRGRAVRVRPLPGNSPAPARPNAAPVAEVLNALGALEENRGNPRPRPGLL